MPDKILALSGRCAHVVTRCRAIVVSGPAEVLTLLGRAVDLPDLTRFDYVDERGARSPTGERRDERFHVALRVGERRVDLSIWLVDLAAAPSTTSSFR
jgi:hypothetical protein